MKGSFIKGDIVDVNLGSPPAEVKGHEQGKIRPCIVIKSFNRLSLITVIPVTSVEPKYGTFTVVKIPKGTGGLTADSYALCHQIKTISFDRVLSYRGKLDATVIHKIHTVLIDTLEL